MARMHRAEKIGLGLATAGHVLLFALLSASFLRPPRPLKLDNSPIDVSIVDAVALKSAAPKIATEPPPPTQAPETGPEQEAALAPRVASAPPPEPRAAPRPPEPRVQKPAEPAPKPKPVEKAKPLPRVAAPAPKPAPAKPKPAITPVPTKAAPTKPKPAAVTPAKPAPAKPAVAKPATAAPARGTAAASRGSRLGPDFLKGIQADSTPAKPAATPAAAIIGPAQKSALDAEIRRQIKPHWKSPTGAEVELLRTSVAVQLKKDGSLAAEPVVRGTTGQTDSNRTQVRLHQEQAIKAIKLAAPFRLPPDLYSGGWESLIISFDKRLSQ